MGASALESKAEPIPTTSDGNQGQYCMFQWSKSRDVGNRDMVLKTFAPDLQKKVKEQAGLLRGQSIDINTDSHKTHDHMI